MSIFDLTDSNQLLDAQSTVFCEEIRDELKGVCKIIEWLPSEPSWSVKPGRALRQTQDTLEKTRLSVGQTGINRTTTHSLGSNVLQSGAVRPNERKSFWKMFSEKHFETIWTPLFFNGKKMIPKRPGVANLPGSVSGNSSQGQTVQWSEKHKIQN